MKNLVGEKMETIKILGAGFSCVDIINCGNVPKISLGGTAANVITVLARFGLETQFLTSEYCGELGEWYKNALQIRNIEPIYFQKSKKRISTVLEEINTFNGDHRFKTLCPVCGHKFVNVILPPSEKINQIEKMMKSMNLFFYDRFSSGIKLLADVNLDGWNVYEPNSFRMYENLLNGCKVADIIKFSEERIPDKICQCLLKDLKTSRTKLVIVSLGRKGVKFSCKKGECWGAWQYLPGIECKKVVDAAGAGDWLTAGFLYKLILEFPHQQEVVNDMVNEKLQFAQRLAAAACNYIGAQGILTDPTGVALLNSITNLSLEEIEDSEFYERLQCPECGFVCL